MTIKKTKSNELIDATKDTMKVGVASMGGMMALGSMGSIPGMPAAAKGVIPIAGAGMVLANTGQLLKTTKTLTGTITDEKPKQKTSSKSEDRIRRMLGK